MEEGIFDCSICVDKLDDAMETPCCHHCFCKRCIEEWIQLKKSCPSCRKTLTAQGMVPNVPIQRMVNNLPSECPNTKRGCTSKLTRGIVKEHLLNSCEFVEILCANQCGVQVFKKDLFGHQRESCPKRLTPCIQCALMITLDSIPEHMSTQCPKVQILCPNCRVLLIRENLHRHHQHECTKITLTCPFNQFGCQFTGLRTEYNKHMIEDSDLHVGVVIEREARMSDEINKLKNELETMRLLQQNACGNDFKPKPKPEEKVFLFDDIFKQPLKQEEFVFSVPQQPASKPQPKAEFKFNFGPQPTFQFKAPEVPQSNNSQPSAGFSFMNPRQPQQSNNNNSLAKPSFTFNFNAPNNNDANNLANMFSFK